MKQSLKSPKSQTASKSKETLKQNLVQKMADALRIKYGSVLTASNYDDRKLKDEIKNMIKTKYTKWSPKDVFKPIETDILDKVRKENPGLKIEPKKARKGKGVGCVGDKCKEEVEKGKLTSQTPKNAPPKAPLKPQKSLGNLPSPKEVCQNIKPQTQDQKIARNELVERLEILRKYDTNSKLINEDVERFKQEQIEKKRREKEKKKEMLEMFKAQMAIKDLRAKEKYLKKQQDRIEILKEIEADKAYERQKRLEKIEKQQKIRAEMEHFMTEKAKEERLKSLEEKRRIKKFLEEPYEYESHEQKILVERRNRIKEEIQKDMKRREENIKECKKLEKDIALQNDNQYQDIFAIQDDSQMRVVRQRVNLRALEQEKAKKHLENLYKIEGKFNESKYKKEREVQENRRQRECEEADKIRKEKIREMKNALDDFVTYKKRQENLVREEDKRYKDELKKSYEEYLKAEEAKKKERYIRILEYKKELDEQIKANKERDLEQMQML